LIGNTDVEDSLERLDELTQEEARMASVELLKMTQSVMGTVEDTRNDVQDLGNRVRDVDHRVQDVDDKLDQVNRSSSL
jgi:methyl-accepting chemotaxis protein